MNKKRFFSKFSFLLVLITIVPVKICAQNYSGGNGTQGNPWQIANVTDLVYLSDQVNSIDDYSDGKYFILTANIDISSVADWTPIGRYSSSSITNMTSDPDETAYNAFKGNFDGGGYTISNLTSSQGGLFGYVSDVKKEDVSVVIRNVKLTDISINATGDNIGGLLNQISFSVKTGRSTPHNTLIENCFCSGTINGVNNVGGVVGNLMNATKKASAIRITGCSSSGTITGSENNVGGIIGSSSSSDDNSPTEIYDCFSIANVEGADYVGGIIGRIVNSGVTDIRNNDAANGYIRALSGDNANRIAGNYIPGIFNNNYSRKATNVTTNGIDVPYIDSPITNNGTEGKTDRKDFLGHYLYDGTDKEIKSVDFDDVVWIDTASESSDPVAINGDFLSVTVINATVTLSHDIDYYGLVLNLKEGAYLIINNGEVNVLGDINFQLPDDYSKYPQLSGNVVCGGTASVSKAFAAGEWTHMSLPFDVSYIKDSNDGRTLTMGDNSIDADYYISHYNGTTRAANGKDGRNWNVDEAVDDGTTITTCSGFMIYPETSVYSDTADFTFVSIDPFDIDNPFWAKEDKVVDITRYPSSSPFHIGWNYIGNPFSMKYNVDGIDYVCYVLNQAGDGYDSYYQDETELSPFRPFFLQVDNSTESILFAANNETLRSSAVLPEIHEVRMTISDGTSSDIFRVHLREDATTGYDLNKDGQKMYDAAPSKAILYSTYSGTDLSINALPFIEGEIIRVPISYYTPQAGTYTLSFAPIQKSEYIEKLLLVNKNTGEKMDLLSNPDYVIVSSGKETVSERFELEITINKTPTFNKNSIVEGIEIVTGKNELIISGLESEANITLYDMLGHTIAVYDNVGNHQPVYVKQEGVCIVKISAGKQSLIQKVIIN